MTPEQWARLKIVFQEALDQPPAVRRAWLEEECHGDLALLREAESLLETFETAGDFLEQPARVDPSDLEILLPGTQVGAYRVLEELGRGGMGVVYLAEDTRLGRRVALKSLPAAVAMHPELRERLRREARAAATISHPSVAVVYALEEMDDHLFIASEYVQGETLRAEIARGRIQPDRARAIAIDIASALGAAHDAGVIHRDLKPENVLIKPDGGVKVVDFGIAQIEGPEATRLTRAGAMLGTPAYMAPEQLLGATVDRRADIYAWGIVMSEMVTGRHPLRGDPPGKGGVQVTGPFATIIGRCLQTDPDARFANARELLQALEGEGRLKAAPTTDEGSFPDVGAAFRRPGTGRFWWEFHQGVTALVYWLMTIPGWYARGHIGGWPGRAFFIVLLTTIVVAANARLHLWFTSRFYPDELDWVHRRSSRWIRIADWAFAATLAIGGALIADERSPLAIVLPSVAVGSVVAFLLIEPVTTRDAFKRSGIET
ncbi:MAG TPA: serine/threonine-protein kinase [Vicinamibacterales bacterium]|nr:serine/threonine-protein kinase [Vicinamibacterales bacterium]